MKHVRLTFTAALACLFLSASCAEEARVEDTQAAQAEEAEEAEPMKTFVKSDQGTVAHLAPGESFEVRLPENPTTGYIWEVETLPAGVLELVREAYEQEPADPEILGRGGTKIFVFKAREPGAGELDLRQRRPWMKEAPVDGFVLKVEVRADE
ncbi:MAG: protease inhibitor I42 family protein [Candidatus Aminicenantes bacterium]|nr:protease inhibitor I42 family protein [Candidatus Aminicenantes bacterium]